MDSLPGKSIKNKNVAVFQNTRKKISKKIRKRNKRKRQKRRNDKCLKNCFSQ